MPRPDPGDPVLVTREEILAHADDDRQVLEAAHCYDEKQARWSGRLKRALRPYGDDSTSVGDALHRASADLGIDADRRGFEALAGLVVPASEARGGATAR